MTTSTIGLKNGHIRRNLTPQKMVKPRDKAGNGKEEVTIHYHNQLGSRPVPVTYVTCKNGRREVEVGEP